MEYLVEGSKYNLSYSQLKEDYEQYKRMQDDEFLNKVQSALHFACIVCYLKEIPSYVCLSDKGVIHQLVHLMNNETQADATAELREIRETFNSICALA